MDIYTYVIEDGAFKIILAKAYPSPSSIKDVYIFTNLKADGGSLCYLAESYPNTSEWWLILQNKRSSGALAMDLCLFRF